LLFATPHIFVAVVVVVVVGIVIMVPFVVRLIQFSYTDIDILLSVCAYRSTLAKPFAHWAYTLSYNIVSFLLHVTHTCMCMCVHMTERVKCVLWFYMNFLESFMHSARKFVRQEFYHNNKSNNKKLPQISFATCVGRRATELLKSC